MAGVQNSGSSTSVTVAPLTPAPAADLSQGETYLAELDNYALHNHLPLPPNTTSLSVLKAYTGTLRSTLQQDRAAWTHDYATSARPDLTRGVVGPATPTTSELIYTELHGLSEKYYGNKISALRYQAGRDIFVQGMLASATDGLSEAAAPVLGSLASRAAELVGSKFPFIAELLSKGVSSDIAKIAGDGVAGKNQIGATFEGGLYRSVPEGRNPLEIHPIFNTEKVVHRYTGEGQGGLYFGSSQRIVNSEFASNGASIEGLVNNNYSVKIEGLLDLTNPTVRSKLGISLDDLVRTGGSKEWRYEITNPLGRYAEDSGYNGIIAPATQADGGINLILFKPNLVK